MQQDSESQRSHPVSLYLVLCLNPTRHVHESLRTLQRQLPEEGPDELGSARAGSSLCGPETKHSADGRNHQVSLLDRRFDVRVVEIGRGLLALGTHSEGPKKRFLLGPSRSVRSPVCGAPGRPLRRRLGCDPRTVEVPRSPSLLAGNKESRSKRKKHAWPGCLVSWSPISSMCLSKTSAWLLRVGVCGFRVHALRRKDVDCVGAACSANWPNAPL